MSGSPAFVFEGLPTRVVFGRGSIRRAGEEIERLGRRRALVLSTPGQAEQAATPAEFIGAPSASDLDEAAAIAVASPRANPRPFTADEVRTLLQEVREGRPPPG